MKTRPSKTNPKLVTLITIPVLLLTLTACTQPASTILLPPENPQDYNVPGFTNNVLPVKPGEENPEFPEGEIPGAGQNLLETLPKVSEDDVAFDIKTSMLEDIEATRESIFGLIEVNPVPLDADLTVTVTGETTTVKNDPTKPDNYYPYRIIINNPNTTITVEGYPLDYVITITNSQAEGFTIIYRSVDGVYSQPEG